MYSRSRHIPYHFCLIPQTLLITTKLLQNIANGIVKNNVTSYGPHDGIDYTLNEVIQYRTHPIIYQKTHQNCERFRWTTYGTSSLHHGYLTSQSLPTLKTEDKATRPSKKEKEEVQERTLDQVRKYIQSFANWKLHFFVMQGKYRVDLDLLESTQVNLENEQEVHRISLASFYFRLLKRK